MTSETCRLDDFSILVASTNGTGSQSANKILLRAIFGHGAHASAKNLFPSNIAGQPTWYTIRVSEAGWTARAEQPDILVLVCPETALEDLARARPGAVVVLDADLKRDTTREDLTVYRVPFGKLVQGVCPDPALRKPMANLLYVGVLTWLLGLEVAEVERAIAHVFAGKGRAAALNRDALHAGLDWARANVAPGPWRVERREAGDRLLIDGNAAAAIGCWSAGVSLLAWYPITPATSLCETLEGLLGRHRAGTAAVLQAEDEMAALGMAIGAGWAGARAMTATSGPGLSLMAELMGLAYFVEVPLVVVDVQRVGPSTGLPTRTQQGDLLFAAFMSHGDTRHPMLLPGTPEEAFALSYQAFDLAERFQTPVLVMSDLDLGMNEVPAGPLPYMDAPYDRGKVLTAEALEAAGEFARYRDADGDGVAARTLPGTAHPLAAYFARGSGHDEAARYSERPEDYAAQQARLARKFESLCAALPRAVEETADGAEVGIVCCGSSQAAVAEARARLLAAGVPTGSLRPLAWPFGPEVGAFLERYERVYVVDQNRDGQLALLLRMAFPGARLVSLAGSDGLPLAAGTIVRGVR